MKIAKIFLALMVAFGFSVAKEQSVIDFSKLAIAAKQNGKLNSRQLAIVSIAALTAAGEKDKLKPALEEALKAGLSVSEIREILSHQSAYIGFPMGLNGLIVFNTLIKEREAAGIKDNAGKEATPLSEDTDYYARGKQILAYLSNRDEAAVNAIFFDSAAVDHGLKAYLFGYLFSRDVISFLDREITTVSTLATLDGVSSQLKSHLGIAKNLGLNTENFDQIFNVIAKCIGVEKAKNAKEVLNSL